MRPSVTKEWQTVGTDSKVVSRFGHPAAAHASASARPFAVIFVPLTRIDGENVGLSTSPFHVQRGGLPSPCLMACMQSQPGHQNIKRLSTAFLRIRDMAAIGHHLYQTPMPTNESALIGPESGWSSEAMAPTCTAFT